MEQVATVQAAPQTSLRQMLGMGQAGQVQGDAFAMIFQQLMGDGAAGEDGDIAALLMQMAGGLQKDQEKLGAQMAAEMLNTMPNLSPQVMTALVQASWGADQANVEAFAAQMEAMGGKDQLAALMARIPRNVTQALEELVMPEEQEAGQQQNRDFLEMLSAAWQEQPKQTARTLTTQLDHASIREAKALMQRDRKQVVNDLPDIEALQAEVDARRFVPVDTGSHELQQPIVPDGEELAQQVKTGIFENVAKGKNEFVVRLKPEGIGEIVVKLSEDKEKISLSILTTSTQTARLISNEVAALQNALKPLNAEVQEITTIAANEQAAQYSAQNQMTDQGRQSHSQQEPGHSHRAQHVTGVEDGFDDTVEAGLAKDDDSLDTYI